MWKSHSTGFRSALILDFGAAPHHCELLELIRFDSPSRQRRYLHITMASPASPVKVHGLQTNMEVDYVLVFRFADTGTWAASIED